MSFDQTTQEIIIEDESGRTVCATQTKGLFGMKRLKNTGECEFISSIITATYDNNFELVQRQTLHITIDY